MNYPPLYQRKSERARHQEKLISLMQKRPEDYHQKIEKPNK